MVSSQQEVLEAFSSFYKELFTSSEPDPCMEVARAKIRSIIPKKIKDEEAKVLDGGLLVEEIKVAISRMANDKALGPDGLPIEFYKKNIDWIVPYLLSVYEEAFDRGSLGPKLNAGVIKLIPKEGDRLLINNWRPITLLNVVYKILAKVLAIRIEKILPNIINSTQTSFVKGRYILENLITCWEAMNWAKASGQDCAMLLIDYEKAYDRIELGFP